VTAAEKEGVDLLIAGALEGKDVASRSFLGAVARPLAKLARCSLLLLTHPQIGPNPLRRIVVMTDFSDCAKTALKNALWLAEADSAELVQVISIHTPFMQARAESGAEYEEPARKREEEEQLLRDFVAAAPACGVPVESKIVDTTTGTGIRLRSCRVADHDANMDLLCCANRALRRRVYSSLRSGTRPRHSSGKACRARRSKGNRVTTVDRSGDK
jgi:nucleotide-binding universal stress UspA family protein